MNFVQITYVITYVNKNDAAEGKLSPELILARWKTGWELDNLIGEVTSKDIREVKGEVVYSRYLSATEELEQVRRMHITISLPSILNITVRADL